MKRTLLFFTSILLLSLYSCNNDANEAVVNDPTAKVITSENLIEFVFEGEKYSTVYTIVGDSMVLEDKEAADILNAVKYSDNYSITFNEDGAVISKKSDLMEESSLVQLRGSAAANRGGGSSNNGGFTQPKFIIGMVLIYDSNGKSKLFTATGNEGIVEEALMKYGWEGKRVLSFKVMNLTNEPWILDHYSSELFGTGKTKIEIPPSSVSNVEKTSIQSSNGGSSEGLVAYLTTHWERLTHSSVESFRYLPKNGWEDVKFTNNSGGRTTGGSRNTSGR